MDQEFDHLVRIDEDTKELVIFRVDQHGTRTLLTRTRLPEEAGWNLAVEKFAMQLGENLLIDSPTARRLLQL